MGGAIYQIITQTKTAHMMEEIAVSQPVSLIALIHLSFMSVILATVSMFVESRRITFV
jgi:hypothetical protein